MTLSGVMTVLKRPGSWEEAKKQLGDANFMSKLLNYDKVCDCTTQPHGAPTMAEEVGCELALHSPIVASPLLQWTGMNSSRHQLPG